MSKKKNADPIGRIENRSVPQRLKLRRQRSTWVFVGAIVVIMVAFAIPKPAKKKADSTPAQVAAINPAATRAAFDAIKAGKKIIDVHEHMQSVNEAPIMLAAMDQAGIGKMILMGSSRFTLTLNPDVGFTGYDANNEELIKTCEKYPGRFEAWPTFEPNDPGKLDKFKALVARGATGLKLYTGHGFVIKKTHKYMFHTMAMDDPQMGPLYEYCQTNFIPVCLHVNPSPKTTPGFAEEFVSVLDRFPDMKLVCPHFMLSSIKSSRLEELLDTYPNLYTDVSFGHDDFLKAGLRRISKDAEKFRRIFAKYPNRIMFATDIVLEPNPRKTPEWIYDRFKAYLDMLTLETYNTVAVPVDDKPGNPPDDLNGLVLPPDLLERVLATNYEAFKALKPVGTKITRKLDWERMGVTPLDRKPGDTLPPPQ